MPTVPALALANRPSNTITGNLLSAALITAAVSAPASDDIQSPATFGAIYNVNSTGTTRDSTITAATGADTVFVIGSLSYADGLTAPVQWPSISDGHLLTSNLPAPTPGGALPFGHSTRSTDLDGLWTLNGPPTVVSSGTEIQLDFSWKTVVSWLSDPVAYPAHPAYADYTLFHTGNSTGVDVMYDGVTVIPATVTPISPTLTAPDTDRIVLVNFVSFADMTIRYLAMQTFSRTGTVTIPIDATPLQVRLTNDYGEFTPWAEFSWVVIPHRIGIAHDFSGITFSAVQSGSDVQVYRFMDATTASRETAALIANAEKPSLSIAPGTTTLMLQYHRISGDWLLRRSNDYGATFEDWS